MRVTLRPTDEERLVVLMARERPRSAVLAAGGDLLTAGGTGEASDGDSSASLEEITADDFKRQSPGAAGAGAAAAAAAAPRSRVWMGYTMSRSYAPAFQHFAWAQAVQNKPLVPRPTGVEEDEMEHVVDSSDGEKEEGEIEEGEAVQASSPPPTTRVETIDLDPEAPEKSDSAAEAGGGGTTPAAEEDDVDFDQRVGSILEELELVTIEEAEKSFEGSCARLHTCFENLKPLFPESGSPMPMLDALVHQAFIGIDTITTVANSNNLPRREQNKELLLKLLFHIKNRYSDMLTPEQRDELDSRVRQLVFEDGKENANGQNAKSSISAVNIAAPPGQVSTEGLPFESRGVNPFSTSSLPKLEIPARNRTVSPLLDLHADYDENSLPSPTRDNAPPFSAPKPIGFGAFSMAPDQTSFPQRIEPASNPLYSSLTDALKAVSSYQQKYGQKSGFMSDDLPSPTPSGDGDKGGDNFGEVSSFQASSKTASSSVNQMAVSQPSSGSISNDGFAGGPPGYVKQNEQLVSGPNPLIKPASKSRDPRLKFWNRDPVGAVDTNRRVNFVELNTLKDGTFGGASTNNRKHKAVDEPHVDDSVFKRARNVLGSPRDIQVQPGRGGWIEDGSNISSYQSDRVQSNQNTKLEIKATGIPDFRTDSQLASNISSGTNSIVTNASILQAPQTGSAARTSVSLPAVLKDIAVNPTMLMQLIQMEQQKRSAPETLHKATAATGMPSNISSTVTASMVLPPSVLQKATAPTSMPTNMSSNVTASIVLPPGVLQKASAPASISSNMSSNVTAGVVLPLGSTPKTTEVVQIPAVRPQVLSQAAPMNSQNDSGVIRMKPRDPRRILHNNIAQKNDMVGSDQVKTNGTAPPPDSLSSKDRLTGREQQAEQVQTSALPSQPVLLSNVARSFTMNTNPVNPVSNSQLAAKTLVTPRSNVQQASSSINRADPRLAAGQNDPNTDTATSAAPGTAPGAILAASPWGDVDHLLDGYDDQQKALIQKERARRIMEQRKMFASQKLCLVLDLDHTLLNSAKFIEVDPVHEEILRKKEEQDRERPQRHLFRFQHMGMWTKLRPGIWNFLEKASKLYELHLYTMGNKLYATEMAKVLDPTGALFAGRVISRGDDGDPFDSDERVPKSKDLDGVLGMESAVVIIDDSVRVWPHNKHNLIVVERYTYFPCSRRQFGLPGPALLEIDRDERPEDGTLSSSLAVIERIHQNFFSHHSLNDADVRSILAAEQQRILSGCRIVFSRIFPVGEANPHLHPLWQTAEQFGAVCTNQIDERVTHVVANSLGTDKVNWALSTGRFVVHPGWVEASALLYRRANEHDFAVK